METYGFVLAIATVFLVWVGYSQPVKTGVIAGVAYALGCVVMKLAG